jgi:hypothetical protein
MDNKNVPRSRINEGDDDKGRGRENIIQNEVKSMFRYGKTTMSLAELSKLKQKYSDAKLIDDIYNEFVKQFNQITKQAEKFAEVIVNKFGTNRYPMHKIMEKALKYKEKLKMSDAAFAEFRRLYERKLAGENLDLYSYRTSIGKALGDTPIEISEGLVISDTDHAHLQEILKLYEQYKSLYHQVMLQSLSYRDLAPQAMLGSYDPKKNNPANHVHPVLYALFGPKITLLEEHFLFANIGYIVKCKYDRKPIDTRPNYELYYDIIKDPNDVVCSVDSPMADLLNRFKLQIKVWESVVSLRLGQYYNDVLSGFLQSIDNCRTSIYEMPELMYVKDEGAVLRRLLASISLRPTLVTTTPLYHLITANPYDRIKMMPSVKQVPLINIRFPPTTLYSDTIIKLEDAITQGHWFIENNTLVPKTQDIFYSRDVLFFYINRRFHNINPVRLTQPYNFVTLPLTTSGYEELNDRPVEFSPVMKIRNDDYNLRSVVCVEYINYGEKDTQLKMITGCSTLVHKPICLEENILEDQHFLYNPSVTSLLYQDGNQPFKGSAPVSPVHYTLSDREAELNKTESFYTKASTTGTVFVYVKRLPQDL